MSTPTTFDRRKYLLAAEAAEGLRNFLEVLREAPGVINALLEGHDHLEAQERVRAEISATVESLRKTEADVRATVAKLVAERDALYGEKSLADSIVAKWDEFEKLAADVQGLRAEATALAQRRDEARADLEQMKARLAGAMEK
jgi:chromosome segregation ATPase